MLFDVTAGERARRIREHPDQPEFLPDPTDPRAEELFSADPQSLEVPRLIADPTDPRNGETAA
jgi:hypothetical protein